MANYWQHKMLVQACINAWQEQTDLLTDVYLGWQFKGCPLVEAGANAAWLLKTIDFFSK
jgi:hypothetical protein